MIDERFVIHRYKATSHATVVGAVLLAILLLLGQLRGEGIHWDLFAVLAAMAATKVAAMIYFHFAD